MLLILKDVFSRTCIERFLNKKKLTKELVDSIYIYVLLTSTRVLPPPQALNKNRNKTNH